MLSQGGVLTNAEIQFLFIRLNQAKQAAQITEHIIAAEIADQAAVEALAENILAHAPRTIQGKVVIVGVALDPEEADIAIQLDLDHFRETGRHFTPQQLLAALEQFAIGLWDFAYGDDIRTLLDPQAHPLVRAWVAASLLPVMRIAKITKLSQLIRLSRNIKSLKTVKRLVNLRVDIPLTFGHQVGLKIR